MSGTDLGALSHDIFNASGSKVNDVSESGARHIGVSRGVCGESVRRWFPHRVAKGSARMRLVCLPYAGGAAHMYQGWQEALPEVEVCAVELPGRWNRVREEPYTSLDSLVGDLLAVSRALPPLATAYFGYSFGALIAFELARRMDRQSTEPGLLLAARRPPRHPGNPDVLKVSDAQLVSYVASAYGPIPGPLLADPEMRRIVLRATRADLLCAESYRYQAAEPLHCPLRVFGGNEDRSAPLGELAGWAAETTGSFRLDALSGGHFFIRDRRDELLRGVREHLRAHGAED
jgi:medium-chain acyl-[acyl-carrier-protein] hydrolase